MQYLVLNSKYNVVNVAIINPCATKRYCRSIMDYDLMRVCVIYNIIYTQGFRIILNKHTHTNIRKHVYIGMGIV